MKDSMKKLFNKVTVNYPLIIIGVYLAKVVVQDATYPDAIVMACLSALYGYKLRMKSLEPKEVNGELKKQISEIRDAISKGNIAKIGEIKKYY